MQKAEEWTKLNTFRLAINITWIFQKVQDRGQKIVRFEENIHGAFNIKVIKLLPSLNCLLIKYSIKISHCVPKTAYFYNHMYQKIPQKW